MNPPRSAQAQALIDIYEARREIMIKSHIPETPEVLAKDRGIDEALEAIAKGDDSALEHLFHTNAEVHALICVGRKWALRDYPLRAAPIEWKTTDAFRNDRFLYIPESEKRQKEPEIAISNDKIRSAFVIKKGAYEKLVCADCGENLQIVAEIARENPPTTPVTLSCEAFCSICDEAI